MTELDQKLMSILHYTETDLAANQRGTITAAQRLQLRRAWVWLLIRVVLCGALAVASGIFTRDHFSDLLESPERALGLLLVIIIFSIFYGLLFAKDCWQLGTDLRKEYVGNINGSAQFEKLAARRPPLQRFGYNEWGIASGSRLHINGYRFNISGKLWRLLEDQNEGHHFQVYFLPYSHRLLSMICLPENRRRS